ncbi:LOW QUALITY PROTEIN: hypothetical protein ACHAW6_002103, partial [Cyclotella cf. meneghiniana]
MAEHAIQSIVYMARTFMVHVSLHWFERGLNDFSSWGFAVKHAAWIHNRLPNQTSGLTPLELLTKTKSDHRDLLRSPARWHENPEGKSTVLTWPGFSDEHFLVANVRHLTTAFVSPQYHVVFDDLFQAVFSSGCDDTVVDTICNNFDYNQDIYAENEFHSLGDLVYHSPPLDEVWLDELERRNQWEWLCYQRELTKEREHSKRLHIPAPTSPLDP